MVRCQSLGCTLILFALLTFSASAQYAPRLVLTVSDTNRDCTDGVDCYCDRVNDSGDPFYDPNVQLCEDFEAPTLVADTNFGGNVYPYGPWYDTSNWSSSTNRGVNSYWRRTYGNAATACLAWTAGTPATPQVGVTCQTGAQACSGPGEWRADDLWDANGTACIDIIQNGEFDDEVVDLVDPVVPGATGWSGVFDGNASMGFRTAVGNSGGIISEYTFPDSPLTTIGIAFAMAQSSNTDDSGVRLAQHKGSEWVAAGGSYFPQGLIAYLVQDPGDSFSVPFHNWLVRKLGSTQQDCEDTITGAVVTEGALSCSATPTFRWRPTIDDYNQPVDWPDGEWGCVRAYYENLHTSTARIRVWFNDTLIVDASNLDLRWSQAEYGYSTYLMNSYANQNISPDTTTETQYRYEDNLHITTGLPPTCEQLGFP